MGDDDALIVLAIVLRDVDGAEILVVTVDGEREREEHSLQEGVDAVHLRGHRTNMRDR